MATHSHGIKFWNFFYFTKLQSTNFMHIHREYESVGDEIRALDGDCEWATERNIQVPSFLFLFSLLFCLVGLFHCVNKWKRCNEASLMIMMNSPFHLVFISCGVFCSVLGYIFIHFGAFQPIVLYIFFFFLFGVLLCFIDAIQMSMRLFGDSFSSLVPSLLVSISGRHRRHTHAHTQLFIILRRLSEAVMMASICHGTIVIIVSFIVLYCSI